jgi:hypothetical protein
VSSNSRRPHHRVKQFPPPAPPCQAIPAARTTVSSNSRRPHHRGRAALQGREREGKSKGALAPGLQTVGVLEVGVPQVRARSLGDNPGSKRVLGWRSGSALRYSHHNQKAAAEAA